MIVQYHYKTFTIGLESGPGHRHEDIFRITMKCNINGKEVTTESDFLLKPNLIETDGEDIHIWFYDIYESLTDVKLYYFRIKIEDATRLSIDRFDEYGKHISNVNHENMMEYL